MLLDAYLKIEQGELSRSEAVKGVSNMLRERAVKNGMVIDDSFRSINGINKQLSRMEYLMTDGKHGLTDPPQIFCYVVDLYKNNYYEFEKLLMDAKGIKYVPKNTRQEFCSWLEINAPKVNPNTVCNHLQRIEKYCFDIDVISNPIFETRDAVVIKNVVDAVSNNRKFRIRNKKQIHDIIKAVNYYSNFVNNLSVIESNESDSNVSPQDVSACPQSMSDDDSIRAEQLTFHSITQSNELNDDNINKKDAPNNNTPDSSNTSQIQIKSKADELFELGLHYYVGDVDGIYNFKKGMEHLKKAAELGYKKAEDILNCDNLQLYINLEAVKLGSHRAYDYLSFLQSNGYLKKDIPDVDEREKFEIVLENFKSVRDTQTTSAIEFKDDKFDLETIVEPNTTGNYDNSIYENTLMNLNFNDKNDVMFIVKILSKDLIKLGIHNKIARTLSRLIILGNATKSEILSMNMPSEKKYIDSSLDKLISMGWVESDYYINTLHRKINTYKLGLSYETLYKIIETKNNTLIKELRMLVDKISNDIKELEISKKDGFIKFYYLPEFDTLVSDFVSLGITKEAAKVLICLQYTDIDAKEILKITELDKVRSQNTNIFRALFSSGWIKLDKKYIHNKQLCGKMFSLTTSLYDIALDYAYNKSIIIEDTLKELKLILNIIDNYHIIKEKNVVKLNKLQSTFISSFSNILRSYKKISENLFDLKMNANYQDIRACIVELFPSDDGKQLITQPLDDIELDNDSKILLYGYFKNYKQYVVWNFADNYNILRQKQISVPIDLIDGIAGEKSIIIKKLSSNEEVITIPEKMAYKAITYWTKINEESEDKWFI